MPLVRESGGDVSQPLGFKTDSSSSTAAQGIISVEPAPFISRKQNLLLRLAAPTHGPAKKKKKSRSCLTPVRKR